ncbi:nickel transport system permease protein NikC [Klebsiella pneumoniae]|uniref:Nickel transport system permease protein NikC n=1 Tax=Klebsiella pneumoniae TaxID=573 RepID=A0A377U4T4_KLEPN|nr:nickel transport system permease protein NikC [Klebsiella pneumoniae]
MIQCFTLMMVTVFVLANLAVDVLNAALDPRLRRHEEVRRMRGLQSFRWPVKLALLVIALLAVIAIGSGWWLPWDPAAIDLQQRLLPPGAAHWLGTDHLGRDIFSRLLAATRVSLGAVMACLLLVLLIGPGGRRLRRTAGAAAPTAA